MMTLQHKALHSVSSNIINYTICPIPIYLHITPSSTSSSTLTADHTRSVHMQRKSVISKKKKKKKKIPLIRHTNYNIPPLEKPNVPSSRHADSHQDTLISLFSSGLLIPLLPYAAYMDYHMLLNSVWIKPEVITLNT